MLRCLGHRSIDLEIFEKTDADITEIRYPFDALADGRFWTEIAHKETWMGTFNVNLQNHDHEIVFRESYDDNYLTFNVNLQNCDHEIVFRESYDDNYLWTQMITYLKPHILGLATHRITDKTKESQISMIFPIDLYQECKNTQINMIFSNVLYLQECEQTAKRGYKSMVRVCDLELGLAKIRLLFLRDSVKAIVNGVRILLEPFQWKWILHEKISSVTGIDGVNWFRQWV